MMSITGYSIKPGLGSWTGVVGWACGLIVPDPPFPLVMCVCWPPDPLLVSGCLGGVLELKSVL